MFHRSFLLFRVFMPKALHSCCGQLSLTSKYLKVLILLLKTFFQIHKSTMADIRSYKIAVPSTAIQELHAKLRLARFPEDIYGDDWNCGTPVKDVRRISKYWAEKFSWASFEERLNSLPHFEATISVEGFDPFQLHFIHQKSSNSDAIPLLFVHGCMFALPLLSPSFSPPFFCKVFKLIPLFPYRGQ